MKLQKLEEMHHAAALEELAPLFTSGADRSKDELIFISPPTSGRYARPWAFRWTHGSPRIG